MDPHSVWLGLHTGSVQAAPDNADEWVFIHLLSGNPLGVLKGTSSWAVPLLGLWLETGLLGFWVIVDGKLLMFLMMPIM